ncbi:MAG: tRNA modification GTPase [Nannocystaceae bacterium]|nr:50S ribosome-binding GTPase [bacterium]
MNQPLEAARSTLVGVATGTPDGGVAIVRVSGPKAAEVLAALGVGTLPPPRRLVRKALALEGGHKEDGLVAWMPGPRSFTGEDVAELHVHAGERNVRAVLEACLRAGATAAGRGDFSRRAFELGALSLDRAEGIAAVIGAQTDEALAQARRLAAGELGRAVESIRDAVVGLRTEVEANLDFPEDVDDGHVARWREEVSDMHARVQRWLSGFEAGRRGRERARFVLAGPPNAGKSSLFNALLGRRRALVADMPGTTRDYVEAEYSVGPHGAWLIDTAGLRGDAGAVEAAGIEMSREQVEHADVVLWVEASDTPAVERPEFSATVVEIETKRDLGRRRASAIGVTLGESSSGIEQVEAALGRWFSQGRDQAWIGLARHRDRAAEALEALGRAEALLQDDGALELIAFELGVVDARLAAITGRTQLGPVGDDVLDRIFSSFCIGK